MSDVEVNLEVSLSDFWDMLNSHNWNFWLLRIATLTNTARVRNGMPKLWQPQRLPMTIKTC